MDDFTASMIGLAFYGVLAALLFVRVRDKKHQSRSSLKSYLLVLGSILGAIVVASLFLWLIVSLFNVQRGTAITAFGSAAIIISIVRAWQWSFAKIAIPIQGYVQSVGSE
jgi:uncharacterized membrane protein